MVISRKEKKKRSKRWTRKSETNSEWNIIQRSLFETTIISLFGSLLSFTSVPLALATIQA